MLVSIFTLLYLFSLTITILSINLLAHRVHKKIELPNVSCVICWMLPVLSLFICMFPSWNDAVLTACYLVNCMPSTVLGDQIPHHLLFPDHPLYTLPPRVFGCTCYVHVLDPGLDKLNPEAI